MGYVAVKGGKEAIESSIELLKKKRLNSGKLLDVETIEGNLRGLIDQVISEGSIYSKKLAALAIKQSEGNVEEAVFLLRAYRSTLERRYYSETIEENHMKIERRISASFKDIVGGQILGASYDYTHRLLDFDLLNESTHSILEYLNCTEKSKSDKNNYYDDIKSFPKVINYLRKEGLFETLNDNNEKPFDVTKEILEFPTKRSARLQCLARGQGGAVTSLAYSALRTFGIEHPTVGELRVGTIAVTINSFDDDDSYYIGEVQCTEVETFVPYMKDGERGKKEINFKVGYGMVFGQNETKAIAMSILDRCLEECQKEFPTGNEEFVLMSIDSVESNGFISHLKLPHYVTFQSELNSVRNTINKEDCDE